MVGSLSVQNPEAHDERIIADLSRCFSVPFKNVQSIYREQLRRLAEGARIRDFLSVLAMRKTRSILNDDRFQKSKPPTERGVPERQSRRRGASQLEG
jgi:hypothetical protein